FINVSSSEGVPVSVMEALSFGIPVIATDAGGTSEIVNNTNGRLIPVDFDPKDLAAIIENLVHDEKYQGYRHNARKSWEENCMASKLLPAFTDFILSV
ncbi:MAG: glycosyltransferase, partial [Bacteroidales bacterium]|nr:glycosyltransferase [Bacteroidales bacterium]